jgi:hypothetical protein
MQRISSAARILISVLTLSAGVLYLTLSCSGVWHILRDTPHSLNSVLNQAQNATR